MQNVFGQKQKENFKVKFKVATLPIVRFRRIVGYDLCIQKKEKFCTLMDTMSYGRI
jgi:hypothetical protein